MIRVEWFLSIPQNVNREMFVLLQDFIAGMAGFLECCHTEWLQYVDQKRKDYPELNVYTVEQLVFLQQQLVKVGSADVSK